MDQYFVWQVDPVIVHLGPLQLRYYGIIFATMLYIGFLVWRRQMLRGGHSPIIAERFLIWGVIAVLVGARLGHVFFYEAERYLADPITILHFWKGGLASHGATLGLVVALIAFAKKYKLSVLETLDRFSMSAAIGAAAVRLGNFFNSEIVGRATDVSWAVRFPLHDCRSLELCQDAVPRHPSQLYEFALGIFVLVVLIIADKMAGKEKRPTGLLASLFLIVYFAGRFCVEFVKEYQVDELIADESFFTMGQYLSIVPFVCGLILLGWAIAHRGDPRPAPAQLEEPASKAPQKKTSGKTKKRKK